MMSENSRLLHLKKDLTETKLAFSPSGNLSNIIRENPTLQNYYANFL